MDIDQTSKQMSASDGKVKLGKLEMRNFCGDFELRFIVLPSSGREL